MRKTNENKQNNTTKNSAKQSEKNVKNCGGKGCGKSTKDCK